MPALPIDQDLFDLLVCPLSRAPLKYVDGRLVSTDPETRRAYRIDGDIPVMLIEEGEPLEPEAWQALMDQEGPVGAGAEAVRARDAQREG